MHIPAIRRSAFDQFALSRLQMEQMMTIDYSVGHLGGKPTCPYYQYSARSPTIRALLANEVHIERATYIPRDLSAESRKLHERATQFEVLTSNDIIFRTPAEEHALVGSLF